MRKVGFILILLILTQFGCEKFTLDTPEGLHHWDILKVEGPSSGSINQTISIDVTYPTSSGCDVVTEFLSDKHGKRVLIKAFGYTTDGFCTQAAVPKVKEYEFSSNEKGEFILKFIRIDNTTINHYITID